VSSQHVWSGVVGISPPAPQDQRTHRGRPCGQPAARTACPDRTWWGWRGSSVSFDNTAPLDNVVPARTKCLLFRCWHRWSRLRCVQTSGNTIPSAALNLCSLCSGRLCFFPLTAITIVSSVVSSAATALQLQLWGDTLSGWVIIPASHTPRCIAAVKLRVSEALTAFALLRPLGALYISTFTRRPQSSVRDGTFLCLAHVYLPRKKTIQMLRSVKDDLGLNVPGMYRIPCECGKVYVVQTEIFIKTRCKEHRRHICLNQPNKSVVAEHSINTGHCMDFSNTIVLDRT
jgi:hypothetical protein